MAVIGSATLNIVPKVEGGLAGAINGEIKKANVSGIGKSAGSGFMGGFASGASIGVWSAVASKAIGAVTSSLGSAASRVDTLNNYPRIMQSLGVESDAANRSISTMSDALSNVPTRLDDMAVTVQGLFAATQKYGIGLDTVTDAGLALNSMLLAGGQSQVVVNSAMEQFRQMVSKGKPELQDWKSLIQAAPGQLNQLAQEMLGASATADDLYAALGGGKEGDYTGAFEWGSISMGEFVEKFAGMRKDFEGAAQDAQGGIGTAFANMKNAVTKGVANVLDAFGQEKIAGAIGDVKGAINEVFGRDNTQGLRAFATEVAPMVSDAWDSMVSGVSDFSSKMSPHMESASKAVIGFARDVAPSVGEAFSTAADVALEVAPEMADAFKSVVGSAADVVKDVAGIASDVLPLVVTPLETAFDVVGGIADLAADAVGEVRDIFKYGGEGSVTGQNKVRALGEAIEAVTGTTDALARTHDALAGTVESAMERAKKSTDKAREAHEKYLDSVGKAADAINEADSAHEAEADRLEYAASVIDLYAGKSELSAAQQRELKSAIETVNELCGTQYGVMEDNCTVIDNETGKVQDNTEEIWNNVRAREAASKAEAIGKSREAIDETYNTASLDFQAQKKAAADAQDAMDAYIKKYGSLEEVMRAANETNATGGLTAQATKLQKFLGTYGETISHLRESEVAMRDAAQSSNELAAQQEALYRISETGSASIMDLALTSGVAAQALSADGTRSLIDFAEAIQTCATDSDALQDALADPEKMASVVDAYDGTAASMQDAFAALGVSWDEEAAKALDAQGTVTQLGDTILAMGDSAYGAMSQVGLSTNDLATALADSGVTAEQLASVSEEDFARMAEACDGSVSSMVAGIALYNQEPVLDKEGRVSADTTQLIDAQGHVYTWNGTDFGSKEANAAVKDKDLMDAYGHVVRWNGQSLSAKKAVVTTSEGGLGGLLEKVRNFINLPNNISKKAEYTTTNTKVNKVVNQTVNAPSGAGNFATGGHIVPRHADGYFATGPTYTSFGLVGEAGWEAVVNNDDGTSDVYPITNSRYSNPLADNIADRMAEKMSGIGGDVYNITIHADEGSGADRLARAFAREVQAINRTRGGSATKVRYA